MRDLYASSFSLCGDGSGPAFEAARERVVEWILGHAATDLVLDRETSRAAFAPGHEVAYETLVGEQPPARLWTCVYRHLDSNDATLSWRTTVQLAELNTETRVTVRVALESVGLRIAPAAIEFGPPRVVRTLIDTLDGHLDGRPLRSAPVRVGSDGVSGLVALLVDPARRLPVVVISTEELGGRPLVPPVKVAELLAGVAHVVVLDTPPAWELTRQVGKLRSVFGGAVRIYWPGFSIDADPYDHRVFMPIRIEEMAARGRPFERFLADYVGRVAVLRVPTDPLVGRIRAESEVRRRAAEDDQRRRLEAARDEIPVEFAGELEAAWDRITDLERQLDERTSELEDVRRSFSMVQAGGVAVEDDDAIEPPPSTLLDALDRVALEYGDALVVLDAARASAEDCPYSNVPKFHAALRAVGEVARLYRDGRLPSGFDAAFEERGIKYGPVSQTALGKYPDEYERTYRGQRITLSPHVKLGSGTSAGRLARIYWWIDEEARLLVIGHAGRHLRDDTV